MHEYAFDVKLWAAVRIKAESEKEARRILSSHLDCVEVNLGALPNGDPLLAEASSEGDADLFEVDGEAA